MLGLSYSLAYTYKILKKLFFHALWTLKEIIGCESYGKIRFEAFWTNKFGIDKNILGVLSVIFRMAEFSIC